MDKKKNKYVFKGKYELQKASIIALLVSVFYGNLMSSKIKETDKSRKHNIEKFIRKIYMPLKIVGRLEWTNMR